MYLRHTTRRKDGKVHTYWQLVRSVRIGRRVVQLWKTMEQWQRRAGLGHSPRTILEELHRIQSNRCRPSDHRRPRVAPTMRGPAGQGPGRPARPPRPGVAAAA